MIDVIAFAKLSGAGNDHICIDGRDGGFDALLGSAERVGRFARALCHRGLGVGADGVIFALATDRPDAHLAARFFEPDGSAAELCGNGTACFTRWALDRAWVRGRVVRIATPAGPARGEAADGRYVRVCIPTPRDIQAGVELEAHGTPCRCDFAVTGVPHAVVYVDDVERVDMARLAPAIRHHERFQPRGVNVNYTQVLGEGHLAVRTFEFGVEDETYACGTGCSTAAFLAARRYGWPSTYFDMTRPVLVEVRSGDTLRAYFATDGRGAPVDACLETVVRSLYYGTLHPRLAARALGSRPRGPSAGAAPVSWSLSPQRADEGRPGREPRESAPDGGAAPSGA